MRDEVLDVFSLIWDDEGGGGVEDGLLVGP